MSDRERSFLLRTLGHLVLHDSRSEPVGGLRRKDLALLAYLCVERPRPHSRARLAALLWPTAPRDDLQRHSLTQAILRINQATDEVALVKDRQSVRSTGAVVCDAEWLLADDERLDPQLDFYGGPFLEEFTARGVSPDFSHWTDRRKAELHNAALRRLERMGAAAEAAGDWSLAQRLGERGTQIDPFAEQAHRRVMRALFARGERNAALRHFRDFAQWLMLTGVEGDGVPDEERDVPDDETLALADEIRAACNDRPPAPPPPRPPPVEEKDEGRVVEVEEVETGEAEEDREPAFESAEPEPVPEAVEPPPPGPETTEPAPEAGPATGAGASAESAAEAEAPSPAPVPPREPLPERRSRAVIGVSLAMAVVLLILTVALLAPAEPREAHPYPVRIAGTLVQGAGGEVKWVIFHGGALDVPPGLLSGYCRSLREVVRVPDAEFEYYRAFASLPPADPPCRHRKKERPPRPMRAAAAR